MDLVRLALERAQSAEEAVGTIAGLLETHGQGGNCGFEHQFYYNNAFLIADRTGAFVLETLSKDWVVKKIGHGVASISNAYSIGSDWCDHELPKAVAFAGD